MSVEQQSPVLQRARVELARAQLVAQVGSDEDFERIVAAQETVLRTARADLKQRLAQLEQTLQTLSGQK
jgi:hypothetical protein